MSKIQANQIQHTQNGAAIFTLPTSDGSTGQFMKTDGSGALSFAATPEASGTVVAAYQDGQTNESTTTATDTWTDTNISITLTPAAAANKFLCIWDTHCKIEVDTGNGSGYGLSLIHI